MNIFRFKEIFHQESKTVLNFAPGIVDHLMMLMVADHLI